MLPSGANTGKCLGISYALSSIFRRAAKLFASNAAGELILLSVFRTARVGMARHQKPLAIDSYLFSQSDSFLLL